MALFSKPKAVVWPKDKTTEIYFDTKENNFYTFETSFWEPLDETTLSALSQFVREHKVTSISLLVPDNVVFTKSFVYDTKIDTIDKNEVLTLAQGFVNFPIDPEALSYTLTDAGDKTIIQSHILDKEKMANLFQNLSSLGLTVESQLSVSESISRIISTFYPGQYFFIYPLENNEVVLGLSRKDSVYLTTLFKGSSFDIQKIINYSNLYFTEATTKLFVPAIANFEISSTTKMDKTIFEDKQIASNLSLPSNLPLPVLGSLINSAAASVKTDIIKVPTVVKPQKTMEENKRNVLPVIAVFVLTAGIASVIFWYVVNRNASSDIETPVSNNDTQEVTPTIEVTPTDIPTPTVAVSKDIKIQVLNATDINGQAATLKARLTELGFTSVAVGNAPTNLTANQVRTKADTAVYSSYFESALGSFFPATYTSDLPASSAYDMVFYIGTDLSSASNTSSSAGSTVAPTKKASATTSITATPTKKLSPTLTPGE